MSEPTVKAIVPLVRIVDGRPRWLVIGSLKDGKPIYAAAPDLEQVAAAVARVRRAVGEET